MARRDAGPPARGSSGRPARGKTGPPARGSSGPVEMAELLDRVVRGMGAPGTDAVDLVFNRWADVVGSVLAARTRPVALEARRLVLVADDPAVVSHVRWLEADLVRKLDGLLGAGRVEGVEVRVDRPGRRGGGAGPTAK